jgi:hypothetical protein
MATQTQIQTILALLGGLLFIILVLNTIVLTKSYNELKSSYNRKQSAPTVPLPEWSKAGDNNVVILAGADALNKYWIQNANGGSTQTLTFPPAEETVASAPTKIVGNVYYMVINNISGHTMTFIAGAGNTLLSFPANLATGHWMIVKVELTNVKEGHEAVLFTFVNSAAN